MVHPERSRREFSIGTSLGVCLHSSSRSLLTKKSQLGGPSDGLGAWHLVVVLTLTHRYNTVQSVVTGQAPITLERKITYCCTLDILLPLVIYLVCTWYTGTRYVYLSAESHIHAD